MTATTYIFEIDQAERAHDLHTLRMDIVNDDLLTSDEKHSLCEAVARKFARLNAADLNPKPRWK